MVDLRWSTPAGRPLSPCCHCPSSAYAGHAGVIMARVLLPHLAKPALTGIGPQAYGYGKNQEIFC
jgi:hypothetical protein